MYDEGKTSCLYSCGIENAGFKLDIGSYILQTLELAAFFLFFRTIVQEQRILCFFIFY
jgi:hypothetical protein